MAGTAEALELLLFARRSVLDDLRLVPAVAGATLSFGLPWLCVRPDELGVVRRDFHEAAPEYADAVAVEDAGLPALDVADDDESVHVSLERSDEAIGLADLEPAKARLLADAHEVGADGQRHHAGRGDDDGEEP